ncbi:MAG: A/G-specific adenine glycosylase [Pseudomonadales bacterium]
MSMDGFARSLLAWFDVHGRKDLPWQKDRTPYRVWISETMLQQTQVATVIPYFDRFMFSFPTVESLAAAPLDDVLHHWTGLGYYARARNLHRAAGIVVRDHQGDIPLDTAALEALPGIGRSTAAAIVALSTNTKATILDGNVKRVLARLHAVEGYPGETRVAARLWALAEGHTPLERVADYTQAIMDLGAMLCTRSKPDCERCPVAANCLGRATGNPRAFPSPKPRRALPVRAVRWFIFIHADRYLLVQRPMEGLWGGLWSPIECPADTPVEQAALLGGIAPTALLASEFEPAFRHSFTHFHLDIEPVAVRIARAPAVLDRAGLDWFAPEDRSSIGLPAPAVRVLAKLDAHRVR